jgi:hypothetical protein
MARTQDTLTFKTDPVEPVPIADLDVENLENTPSLSGGFGRPYTKFVIEELTDKTFKVISVAKVQSGEKKDLSNGFQSTYVTTQALFDAIAEGEFHQDQYLKGRVFYFT